MKRKIRKIVMRTFATLGLCFAILLTFLLNPSLLYANKTKFDGFVVLHQQPLHKDLESAIRGGFEIAKQSELFNENLKIVICMDDGSKYPSLMEKWKGRPFAVGMANKTVMMTNDIHYEENTISLKGYPHKKRSLTQLFAHEFLHNYQAKRYGLRTLRFPIWKLEGHPEYISQKITSPWKNLKRNISQLEKRKANSSGEWDRVEFEDGNGTTFNYFRFWVLNQYLMEIKGMTYTEIVKLKKTETDVYNEMIKWYENN